MVIDWGRRRKPDRISEEGKEERRSRREGG
jgi:hypothetical protein